MTTSPIIPSENHDVFYYVHGLNSSANSGTSKNLEKALGVPVTSLEWKSDRPFDENLESLKKQVESINSEFDEIMFIGTSLGAFYAFHLSEIFCAPRVLFNPLCYADQLRQFIGTQTNHSTGETYNFTEDLVKSYAAAPQEKKYRMIPTKIYVSDCDEVLPNNLEIAQKRFDEYQIHVTQTKHRITDFTPYADEIRRTFNTILF